MNGGKDMHDQTTKKFHASLCWNKKMHGWSVSDKGQGNNRNRKMHFNNMLKQINEVLKLSWIRCHIRDRTKLEFHLWNYLGIITIVHRLLWSSVSAFLESSMSYVFHQVFPRKKNIEISKSFLSFPRFATLDLVLRNDFVYHFIIRPCDLTLLNVQWDVELQYLNPVLSIPFIQTR